MLDVKREAEKDEVLVFKTFTISQFILNHFRQQRS